MVGFDEGEIIFDKGEIIRNGANLHLDQGIARHQSRQPGEDYRPGHCQRAGSRVSQANEAQFYVSMSRARFAMHVFTDSKVALRDAVTKPSKRLSSWEIVDATEKHRALKAELDRQRAKEQMEQQEKAYER